MKKYYEVELNVVEFSTEDIVKTSGGFIFGGGTNDMEREDVDQWEG